MIKFPIQLDDFTDPVGSSSMEDAHPELHKDVNDAIEALESKVGITDSADVNSLDYKVRNMGSVTDHSTLANLTYATAGHTGFEPAKGADDNYVTDAQKIIIGNTSGTNTGDNATNSQYSGLATSKQDALNGNGFVKATGTTISYDNSTYLTSVEGTALKSTGEAGGTKYLREDGDGTCSWQTPSYPTRDSLGLDTDDSPQFAGIELGNASDTTLTRSAAGVLAVESVVIPSISSTNTLTNKRITKRVASTTDDATAVIDSDSYDEYYLTAIANATEISVTGTPTNGQTIFIGLKDAGVTKNLTWTGITGLGVTLPTATTAGKQHIIGIKYIASAWRAIAVGVEA